MAAEDEGRSSLAQEASSRNSEQDASQPSDPAEKKSQPSDPAEKKPQSLDDRWMAGWSRARDAPGRIAFHRSEVNANLLNNLDRFLGGERGAEESRRVLVTLCGKTVDMPFLASKGLDVVGVEGIQTAIDEFREEHPDIPLEKQDRTAEGGFEVYAAPKLSLLRGNFFELTATSAGTYDLCLDRAALVAVHPSLREKYVAVLDRVLKPGARILLICMNYNQEEMSGPPYSIDPAEVTRLFGYGYDIEQLASNDVLADYPRFVERGCTALREDAHLLIKR